MHPAFRILSCLAVATAAAPPLCAEARTAGSSILDYVGECVPFARQVSGIQIWGDAWTWWEQARGKYRRGDRPEIGAVLVFAKTDQLRFGHVSVVSRIIEDRTVMVTHANWSRIGGKRGHAEQDVTLFDVSKRGDWSEVKVWYRDNAGLGGSSYPVYGFIYGTPMDERGAPPARPAAELTGHRPDYVGSLIDAYAR